MKAVFIGCVDFSYRALQTLIALDAVDLVGVVTRSASRVNSDFCDLTPLAETAAIPAVYANGMTQDELAVWISDRGADIVYCLGWSELLGENVLKSTPMGVIGYHPTALPDNRGRHPIIWALALGLEQTASTFFFMDRGADTGDIIDQVPVRIAPEDDAAALYAKLTEVGAEQLTRIATDLSQGIVKRTPQGRIGNSWRRRSPADGRIDWRMGARTIHNLVRSLARPYPGASCHYMSEDVKIWRTDVVPYKQKNVEPGKVLEDAMGRLIVKCGEDALALLQHEFSVHPKPGTYL